MHNPSSNPVVRFAALLAIIGIIYSLVIDILSTFSIEIFLNPLVGCTTLFLSLFSAASFVFFFVVFASRYLEYGISRLKIATLFLIGGACLMLLLHIKGFALHFKLLALAPVFRFPHLEPLIPWFNSLLLLVFFAIFHLEMAMQKQAALARATICGVVSSAIAFLMRCGILFLFLSTGTYRWFSELPFLMKVILLPLTITGHALMLCFFLMFRRELH